jgi:quercetin dioxygenase-like cupin family protein
MASIPLNGNTTEVFVRSVRLAIGVSSIVFCGVLAAPLIPVEQSTSAAKPTPLILASGEGERREFRARPGVTFTVKIDPKNSGSEHMVVVMEDMAPGDKIPTHRHPHADELIFIQSGTGRVTLGDKVQEAHAGAVVFIPSDTWIGMENIGKEHLTHIDVWSAPGFEEYMRAISVLEGQPIVPLSKAEVDELRKKYSHYGIYQ